MLLHMIVKFYACELGWKNLLLLVLGHLVNMHTAPPVHDFSGMSAEHCTLYLHTNSNLASWKAI